jgi:hypothetical protein
MIFDFQPVEKKVTFARMVSSKCKIVSNFEQLILTRFINVFKLDSLRKVKIPGISEIKKL